MLTELRNARIVQPESVIRGSIVFDEAGVIRYVGAELPAELKASVEQRIDAGGCIAVPGGIDAHVHFGGFGDIPIRDDFASGSRGALAGGTTTVIDFCEPAPGESVKHCVERRKQDAAKSQVDYKFHFVLTKDYREQLTELPYLTEQGISDFKLFTTYDNENLTYEEIEEIVSRFDGIQEVVTFLVHAEDERFLKTFSELSEEEARCPQSVSESERLEPTDMRLLARSRPRECEAEAIRRLSRIAKDHKASISIAHVTTAEATKLKWGGSTLILETCPHYLTFTEDALAGEEGCLYTMTPPLRTQADREALWSGVENGAIEILSTDHCPYSRTDKHGHAYFDVPCGVDGVETRMRYLFSEGVVKRHLSLSRFVELTSSKAAKFYHLYPRKGALQAGSYADIVLLDPDIDSTVGVEELHSAIDYSIYEGLHWQGGIHAVYKQGVLAYDGNTVCEGIRGVYVGDT